MPTPIQQAAKLGQAIWYDNLRRSMLTTGALKKMIEQDGLLGMTSNPSIFEKAIGSGDDYDAAIHADKSTNDIEVFEHLAIHDIQGACDAFRPVFDRTKGGDGYVSLEVSPRLANDTDGTIGEAKRLFAAVDRPNVMIKIPGTAPCIPAIRAVIGAGINVNTTLLFAIDAYLAAADAYISGLEDFKMKGGDLSKVAGVASFFLSRIDTAVDKQLDELAKKQPDAAALKGKTAIANAKLAYTKYQELIASPRWKALVAQGAKPQRLLWASTGTKNPAYPKLHYVETLIGPDTVNTVPTETYDELRDHGEGHVAETLTKDVDTAKAQLAQLGKLGVSLDKVTDKLLVAGAAAFAKSFDTRLAAVASTRASVAAAPQAPAQAPGTGDQFQLGDASDDIASAARDWAGKVPRVWKKDATVWTGKDEGKWLGWLDAVETGRKQLGDFIAIAEAAKKDGLTDAIVLGMGGSSLCPWVFTQSFAATGLKLHVLDSILAAQILAAEKALPIKHTLFIVSSKSGSTTEPNVLMAYFLDRVKAAGIDKPGSRFVAITDPGSKLETAAKDHGFRATVAGDPTIGGRYSALSPFGLVPAQVMGIDVKTLLDRAGDMATACKQPDKNPGVQLGVAIGVLATRGRDKLTIVASPKLRALGAWLEQLIAESTGKLGKGIVPVDNEPLGAPEVYGADRVFVHVQAKGEADPQSTQLDALAKAGHPVLRLDPIEAIELGKAFFRWEMATAVAGSVIGIDPFDQPDVEASKIATRRLLEAGGNVAGARPIASESGLSVYADVTNTGQLTAGRALSFGKVLAAHLSRASRGDYVAINAYVEMNDDHQQALQAIRMLIRDNRKVATTLGYGPRFLHSTGQLHKGGPASGVFLQLTAEPARELAIPGETYTFATLERAQAQGDFEVLSERGRRAIRVHLGSDVAAGLAALHRAVSAALGV